jgi:hypothetical protein
MPPVTDRRQSPADTRRSRDDDLEDEAARFLDGPSPLREVGPTRNRQDIGRLRAGDMRQGWQRRRVNLPATRTCHHHGGEPHEGTADPPTAPLEQNAINRDARRTLRACPGGDFGIGRDGLAVGSNSETNDAQPPCP